MLREEIANNLKAIIDDADKLGINNINAKHWTYRDYIYVKQAMQYLKTKQYNAHLTAKADFSAIMAEFNTLLENITLNDEQKDLCCRIAYLLVTYEKDHLKVTP